MNQISLKINPVVDEHGCSILNLAFRPFFLFGALLASLYIFLWINVYADNINITVYEGILWWHIHEMLYGFVGAIIVGFLLTAVQTWTQLPGLNSFKLGALFFLWLSGRISMFLIYWIHPGYIALIDLSFLPIAAIILSVPIIKRRMWRNLIFVPILLLMTYANAHMHCSVFLPGSEHLTISSYNQVFLIVLLMVIIGGRVIPMFTANGTGTLKVSPIKLFDIGSVILVFLIVVLNLLQVELSIQGKMTIFGMAAFFNAIRVFRWRIWVTWKTPMVLFLHLSYWCIPIGLILFGLANSSKLINESQAIHTLTVGAMGIMIISMISRVSLGHTGRSIFAGKVMTCAFTSILVAFIIRVFGVLFLDYTDAIIASGSFWVLGFSLFLYRYFLILISPRIDGKPG